MRLVVRICWVRRCAEMLSSQAWIWLLSGLNLVLFCGAALCYIHIRRAVRKKKFSGRTLEKQIFEAKSKKIPDRRRDYRLAVDDEPCQVQILDFGDRSLRKLNNKNVDAKIKDISLGGIRLSCPLNFPIKEEVLIHVSFPMDEGTRIHMQGTVAWKKVKHGRAAVEYGVAFQRLSAAEETRIQNYMNHKELEKISVRRHSGDEPKALSIDRMA